MKRQKPNSLKPSRKNLIASSLLQFRILYAKEGVEEGSQGKMERAKKLFQTALDIADSKQGFEEANGALREIEEAKTKRNTRDWYSWWFSDNTASFYKKALGVALLALMLFEVSLIIYQTLIREQLAIITNPTTTTMSMNLASSISPSSISSPSDLSSSSSLILGSLGIIIIVLVLPLVTHLKIGLIIDLENGIERRTTIILCRSFIIFCRADIGLMSLPTIKIITTIPPKEKQVIEGFRIFGASK